jgi:phosphoglycolate phosphatase
MARALRAADGDATLEKALALFHAYYIDHPAKHTTLMAGADAVLRAGRALPRGLCTNKARASTLAVVTALGLDGQFSAIFAGGDGPLKPDPGPVRALLAGFGVAADETWMVGDGPQDVLAGKAAGCFTVAVLGGFASRHRLEAARPDWIVGSLYELVDALSA